MYFENVNTKFLALSSVGMAIFVKISKSMKAQIYQVVVADPQFLVVTSVQHLLEADNRFSMAGVVSTRSALVHLLGQTKCNLLIIDPLALGFEKIADLQPVISNFPEMSILMLVNSIGKLEFTELAKMGIKNILYKSASREEFLSALDACLKGKKYFADEILEWMIELSGKRSIIKDPISLTTSEIEIVKLIAGGLTTNEIAEKRNISFHTVVTHRKNIFRKLGVSSVSELIILAIKSGWIDNIEYFI
jgi:DNA-binding NarL/FixJ family response regulator